MITLVYQRSELIVNLGFIAASGWGFNRKSGDWTESKGGKWMPGEAWKENERDNVKREEVEKRKI